MLNFAALKKNGRPGCTSLPAGDRKGRTYSSDGCDHVRPRSASARRDPRAGRSPSSTRRDVMNAEDRRFLCTALGFTVVLLRGDKLQAGERAARAHGIAALIEAFIRDAAEPALIDRMAAAISALGRDRRSAPSRI